MHTYLYGVVGSLFSVQTANSRLDDSSILFNFKDRRSRVLVNHVLLDRVLQFGVGALLQVVVIDGGHRHDHHASGSVFRHVTVVDAL